MSCPACGGKSRSWEIQGYCFLCGWVANWTVFDIIRNANVADDKLPDLSLINIAERVSALCLASSQLVDHLTQLQLALQTDLYKERTKAKVLRWTTLLVFETLQTAYILGIPLEDAIKKWYYARQKCEDPQQHLEQLKW